MIALYNIFPLPISQKSQNASNFEILISMCFSLSQQLYEDVWARGCLVRLLQRLRWFRIWPQVVITALLLPFSRFNKQRRDMFYRHCCYWDSATFQRFSLITPLCHPISFMLLFYTFHFSIPFSSRVISLYSRETLRAFLHCTVELYNISGGLH